MEDVCLVVLSAYDVLWLLVVISTHRHSDFVDWIHVHYLSEERLNNVAYSETFSQ